MSSLHVFFQPSQVLSGRLLGPEPPPPRWRTERPPVTSGPGHGAVHTRADGCHNELWGLGPSPHPSAYRRQPGSDEAAGLSRGGQAARASTYEPMTRRASLGKFISWLFFFFLLIFFKKQSKKIWMLETIKIQNCTSTHYIYCPSLEFVRGSGTPASATDDITVSPLLLRHLRSHDLFVFWPSLYELDWKSFGEKAWNQRRCKLSMQLI